MPKLPKLLFSWYSPCLEIIKGCGKRCTFSFIRPHPPSLYHASFKLSTIFTLFSYTFPTDFLTFSTKKTGTGSTRSCACFSDFIRLPPPVLHCPLRRSKVQSYIYRFLLKPRKAKITEFLMIRKTPRSKVIASIYIYILANI